MTKFIVACLFLLNIISIYCIEASLKAECDSIEQFFKKYIESSGSSLELSDCCDEENENICQNGHVVQYKLSPESNESIDFSDFPSLPNISTLVIEGHVLKDNIIPANLFTIPSLKYLNVTHAGAKIPSIPESCSVEYLDLYKNDFNGFPSTVTNCKKLKLLNLSHNNLSKIPSDIEKLVNLEYLYIGAASLTSLSERIYTLKLKEFDIDGNPDLSTKILNFPAPVEMCDLRDVKVICYESNTCKTLVKTETPHHEIYPDAEKVYGIKCNGSDIDDKNDNNNNNKLIYVIISLLFIIIIFLCVIFFTLRRSSKKKEKNELKADIVVSPLITVSPSDLNNLKDLDNIKDLENLNAGDRKSVLSLDRNNILPINRNSFIPGDRKSILIGDPSLIPTIQRYNETVRDVDTNVTEKREDAKLKTSTSRISVQELHNKKNNSFENLTGLINGERELPVSSPSTNSRKISVSKNTYKVLPSPTLGSVKLSPSPTLGSVKLSPSPTVTSYIVSPSNSQRSEKLTQSNSQNSNRHSIVPLVLSSEQGQHKPNAKAMEALQNSFESSIEYGINQSNSLSSGHSTVPLIHSTEQGQQKPSAKVLESLQNSYENYIEYSISQSNSLSSNGHSTIPMVFSNEQGQQKSSAKTLEVVQNILDNSIENGISPSNSQNSNRHSTVPLVLSSEQGQHQLKAKALEALQNRLDNLNNIEPPPSYSDPTDTNEQNMSSSVSPRTSLSHSTHPLPLSRGKEPMDEQTENDIYAGPIIIDDDRSPIGVIKKTYTLPPYSPIPFNSDINENEEKSTNKKDKQEESN